jgi:hypothetical protein
MKKRTRRKAPRIATNSVQIAMANARRLLPADVANHRRIVTHALEQLMRGEEPAFNWSSMADSANVAEQLSAIGIGSGEQADAVIERAQKSLADVYRRQSERGSWTMRAEEIDALRWLIELHSAQLAACSYGEFERALRATAERVSQAVAGNAPRGAHVLIGLIDDRSAFSRAG